MNKNDISKQIMEAAAIMGIPAEVLMIAAATKGSPTGNLVVERSKDKKIILPEGMSYEEAIKWCQRKIEEENAIISIDEVIDAFPFDGIIALMKVLKEVYGWTSLRPTPGFFGSNPPSMISVNVSKTETVQVPWGRIEIPNVSGYLQTGWTMKEDRLCFKITGQVKAKHKEEIHDIAEKVRTKVKIDSIYKGKPIRVEFPDEDHDESFDPWEHQPTFLDVQSVNKKELIFSKTLNAQVQTNLFNPILHTDQCRKHGIPLKRGILMEGPYGVGKSLTANVLAQMCEDNGWTYVYLRDASQLAQAVDFAKRYQPAVIFAEDIDKVISGGRSHAVNNILNVIDGIDSKGTEIMVVLTTNHIEEIEQAMLRPGRLDAVISLRYPDAEAAAKLIRLYGRGLINDHEDLESVGQMLDGSTPAVLREVVERSKLSALGRLQPGEKLKITATDLEITAEGMKEQLKLLEPKQQDKRTNAEKLGDAMGRRVVEGMERVINAPEKVVQIPRD